MNNDHLINLDYMPKSCMFDNLSRKHFVIKKHSDRVTLTDHSHWGTYIQKSKVGKVGKVGNGKSVDLEHGDIISVYKADHTCFQFKLLSEEESEGNWMPNENLSMNASLPTRRTPRKPSPSSVNLENLKEGKRTRFPKKDDDFIYKQWIDITLTNKSTDF